ncbi:MAG: hypothetical protein JST36_01350 [Bacteroidetes bacterium]|nr:hypothetical protein [Bacteroidota bacterium]
MVDSNKVSLQDSIIKVFLASTTPSIVFLGSKPLGFLCFQHLLEQQSLLGFSVDGLLTKSRPEFQEEYNLRLLAEKYGITILDNLDDLPECDILYSVQYHELLLPRHIQKAKTIALNLHMAPLPEYRGCNQFSFAIIDKKEEFGTTLHVMDAKIDHGDIISEKRFPIPEGCWVNELYKLSETASLALFRETLPTILKGTYTRIAQQQLIPQRGTCLHYRHEIQALRKIDLSWPEEKILRHIRATSMPGFAPPYCLIGQEKIYLRPSHD